MKQQTLQEQYNLIVEGKGNVTAFHKQALKQFPHLFTAQSSFDQVVNVLKQKSIISEMIAQGLVSNSSGPNFFEIFNANMAILAEEAKAEEKQPTKAVTDLETKGYDYKDKKNINNQSGSEFLLGFYVESRNPKNADKTVDEVRDIVVKNLSKDQLHYVKSGQFGIEGLGYSEDHPGLGPTKAVKGKYASSGMEPVKLKESKQLKEAVDVYTINAAALLQAIKTNPNYIRDVKNEIYNDLAKTNIVINTLDKYAKDNASRIPNIKTEVESAKKELRNAGPMRETKDTLVKEILKRLTGK
jgi:hypothetical protein